jgi:hypothetical protein
VLLEEPPSGSSGPPPYPTPHPATLRPLAREAGRGPAPTLPPPTQASVLPLREEGDLLELEANADAQGFLVLAESWYPGWQAWVDDEPVKVYRADYVYQGVFLTAGPHKVRFQYLPTRLQTGALLSAAGLAIWIAGLALRRSSRRDRAG